jgi:hypothetical protein
LNCEAGKSECETASRLPLERQDVLAGRPSQWRAQALSRQQVGSAVGLFGLVADDVRKDLFGKLARKMRFEAGTIAERASEAMRPAP